MLFYIKHEIIGDETANKLDAPDADTDASLSHVSIDLQLPEVPVDLPADWWDKTCDASLLIGVYKHGFEKYAQLRLDEKLCFLSICGPPDAQEILAEEQEEQQQQQQENEKENAENDEEKPSTQTTTAATANDGESKAEEKSGEEKTESAAATAESTDTTVKDEATKDETNKEEKEKPSSGFKK